jgi:hypothetical protein
MPQITQALPDRDRLPALEEFFVQLNNTITDTDTDTDTDSDTSTSTSTNTFYNLSDITWQWIASMVSSGPQPRTPLKAIGIEKIYFRLEHWKAVIMAIDLSALERLEFNTFDFDDEQLKLLVDRIEDSEVSSLPLKLLDIQSTFVEDDPDIRAMLARIREKAPQVEILV